MLERLTVFREIPTFLQRDSQQFETIKMEVQLPIYGRETYNILKTGIH